MDSRYAGVGGGGGGGGGGGAAALSSGAPPNSAQPTKRKSSTIGSTSKGVRRTIQSAISHAPSSIVRLFTATRGRARRATSPRARWKAADAARSRRGDPAPRGSTRGQVDRLHMPRQHTETTRR